MPGCCWPSTSKSVRLGLARLRLGRVRWQAAAAHGNAVFLRPCLAKGEGASAMSGNKEGSVGVDVGSGLESWTPPSRASSRSVARGWQQAGRTFIFDCGINAEQYGKGSQVWRSLPLPRVAHRPVYTALAVPRCRSGGGVCVCGLPGKDSNSSLASREPCTGGRANR